MKDNVVSGHFKQFRVEVSDRWPQLTPDDVAKIDGTRNNLVRLLEVRYEFVQHRAQKEVDSFLAAFEEKLRLAA
jgi:hypothetical protein